MGQDRKFILFIRLLAVLVLATAVSTVAPSPRVQAAVPAAVEVNAPAASGATCVVLQPGSTGKDAYIKQEKVDERQGGSNELKVKTETGKLIRSLLQFDLTSIPANSTVSSATLSLFVKDANGGSVTINAHRVTQSWKETEVTWKARDKAGGLLWTNLGADYDAAVAATATLDDTKNVWKSWSITSLAGDWVLNPATNYGLILESPVTNPKVEKKFKSSEDGTALQRPKLEVCYNAAVSIQPDNSGNGTPGLTRTYAHVIHVGSITSVINLTAASSQGWATRIYKDVNGNGLKDAEDTLISATPLLGPNVDYAILVQVDVPVSAPGGMVDETTVTATAQASGASSSAKDRTQVGRMLDLKPDRSMNATAGSVIFYGHTLTNNGENRDCIDVSVSSSLGWTVFLWDDLNHNAVHETSNPDEPALGNPVCLNPNETKYLVAEVRVAPSATAGQADQTVIRAVSGNVPARFDTATDTTTVFVDSPPVVDGKYDMNYADSPYGNEVCYNDTSGKLFGKLASYYQPTSDAVYFVLAIDKDFVDNTYGANAVGWSGGHTFGNLTGSDHAQFQGYDADGTKVLDLKLDYLTSTTGTPSGYATLGVTGGEGDMIQGNVADVKEWGTSLDYSMNDTGYCSGGNCFLVPAAQGGVNLEVDSPPTTVYYAPNTTYPNWIFDVIYEVKVAKSAFGAVGFGSMDVPYIHASPSKAGTNTIYAEPGVCPGEIGDFVWHDQDGDTVQDPGEPGIGGVKLNLYRDDGDGFFDPAKDTLVTSATTDAAGKYLFQNLAPDDYFVDVVDATVPAGYKTTTYNDPTTVINLGVGDQYLTADFGYGTGAPIGDYVWEDLNGDGIQSSDEPGVAGVTVKLLDGSGNVLATTLTDGIGAYLFLNRPAGTYMVEFTPPAGYSFTLQGQGGNAAKDSDPNPATGRTAPFTTTAVPDLNRDAGLVRALGSIGDFVWYDADGDGIEDVGEPGIANVTLDLYRDGVKIASTVTDADGGYIFPRLAPGNYIVDVTDQNGVLAGLTHIVAFQSQPDPTATITLSGGELYKDADFGYVRTPGPGKAIIGDTVWYDGNGDRFQQPEEQGIPGIQVCATPGGGGTPICATTDPAGHYLLEVLGGSYTVAPTNPPAGYSATTPGTQSVTVAAGQQYLDADFGYNSPNLGSIGNLVFLDANKDGVFNGSDTALGGVSVDLIRNTNGNTTWDPGEPIIATTTTATSLGANTGNYLFTGVPAGNYLVHVSDTNGVLTDFTKSVLGTADVNNNNQADPYRVTLATGGSVLTADFGYYLSNTNTGQIGNQVWVEKDGDGIFSPATQDVGQAGVTVELLQGGVSVAATTTGAGGDYLFVGLDAGTYTVEVTDDLGVLGSYRVTRLGPNQGQDNNNQAQPYAVTLPANGRNMTADFGYILPGAIGDYVWYDTNANGLEDVNEPGIGNVTLRLYRDNGDGVFNTGSDALVGTTVTDKDGGYIFNGLLAGGYWVDPDQSSPALSGLTKTSGPQSQADPFGIITLTQGQIYRDADFGYVSQAAGQAVIGDLVWYDANGDGLYQSDSEVGAAGIQVCATPSGGGAALCATTNDNGVYHIQVPPGSYTIAPTNPPSGFTATTPTSVGPVTVVAGDQYLDADFGYDSPDLGKIGGTVWHDLGRDGLLDSGEPGIPSVSVDVIRDTNGNGQWDAGEPIIGTTTTDPAGNYEVNGLPAGNYLVVVSDTQKVLDDFVASALGPNPGQDNNNQAQPYAIALPAGGSNTTADFGYMQSGSVDKLGVIGNQVWYEEDGNGLYNPEGTDVGVAGVTVKLYRDGVFYATTTTGASGDYVFSSLPAGNYSVSVSDGFGILANLLVTVLGPNPGQDNNNQAQPYAILLASAALNMTADFGYTRPGAIGDLVWYDADGDGIEDVSEPGIANVTLDLYRDGVKIASTVTDADGGYLFPKLVPGNYVVDVTDLNGVLTGLTHIVDRQSQPDPTASIKLAAGEVNKDADFGYVKTPGAGKALIGDTVWYDGNGDGFQQPGEPGIPGVQVCATPVSGGAGICATTDSNGHYLLEVPAGSYNVAPASSPGGTATTPVPHPVTVTAGQQYLDADFGYNLPNLGSIGNLVFLDANKDGVFNGSDTALGGVSVDLIRNTNGNTTWDPGEPIIATTTTATSLGANTGNYLFTGVPAGNYLVHVSDTNAVLTDFTKSVLGTPGADSQNQADPYAVTLAAGGSNLTADFGYWRANRPDVGVIGNQVWVEKDGNGLFELAKGEFGQHGVTLELYRDSMYVAKTTTGASGDYAFVGLTAGSYTVRVSDDLDVLTLYTPTALGPNPGQDNNNQAQPYGVVLAADGYNLTADFGYLIPISSVGDTVFYDDNRSGAQDPGEDGISAVIVQLWTDNGGSCNKLQATTTTDGNGKYLFPNLPPAHYCVTVPEVPADNPSLSGLERTAGTNPHALTLANNQNYVDADFGYAGRGIIRGVVYFDLNGDGLQQPNEPGIANVQICLYPDVDKNGVPDSGTPIACTTTDSTGTYVFPALLPSSYAMTETDPTGLTSSTPNTINTTLIVVQGSGISDNNNFGDLATSSYTITKTLTTVGEPFRPNTPISFEIVIRNTGNTTITFLPLKDMYDKNYLQYVNALPASVDNVNDGAINWVDITATAGDLAPGQSATVKVNFIALQDTSNLPGGYTINTAMVTGATADPDGPNGPLGSIVALQTLSANDTVAVFVPTGVLLESFTAEKQADGVLLSWTTATEQAVVGFNVYREAEDGALVQVNPELIVAQNAGADGGATYTLPDIVSGQRYVLEIVKTDGTTERNVCEVRQQ